MEGCSLGQGGCGVGRGLVGSMGWWDGLGRGAAGGPALVQHAGYNSYNVQDRDGTARWDAFLEREAPLRAGFAPFFISRVTCGAGFWSLGYKQVKQIMAPTGLSATSLQVAGH